MLTFIHGEDTVTSRKALKELLEKNPNGEKIYFDGAKVTLTDIISASDSLSLFGQKRVVCIENFLKRPVGGEKDKILDFIKNEKTASEIIIWEEKEVGKAAISKYFGHAKVIFCPLPAILFKFLDAIGERHVSEILTMFHSLLTTSEAEFIFSMIVRQWRYLVMVSDPKTLGATGLSSWQLHKFAKQTRFFQFNELISSYRQLLSLDARVKMGLTPFTLSYLLDIFFIWLYYKN